MIPEEVIEQVAAANDVVDVISGYIPVKRAGAMYKALCPFHKEKTPSFNVNPARQTFKCFGCGVGGSVFKFVELYESVNFPEAVRRLAARAGIPLRDEPMTPEEDAQQRLRRRLMALHGEAAEWFYLNLFRSKAAAGARAYLKGRGLTAEVARSWQLGYAPESWDAFTGWAQEKGYTAQELIVSGLVSSKESEHGGPPRIYDRFRDRLMFPICDDIGNVVAFSGRILNPEAIQYGGKYVNSPETPIFTKGRVLFGLHKSKRAIIDASSAIVCEGQLDMIAVFEAGLTHVIASQGTAFTDQHARMLKRFTGESGEVVLCFDSDSAGLKAAERALPPLLKAGLAVRMAEMPPDQDPDSFIRAHGAEAFRERVDAADDFFAYQLERLAREPAFQTARGKAAAARKLGEQIALVDDAVLRQTLINEISARLEITPDQLATLVKKPAAYEVRERAPEPAPSSGAPFIEGEEEAADAPPKTTATTRLLCQLLLITPEARTTLAREAEATAVLGRLPEGGLPLALLQAQFQPGDAASLAAYLSTLTDADQSFLAGLLDLPLPTGDPETTTKECWLHLYRKFLEAERKTLLAKMRKPGLKMEEVVSLQKQVLDLTRQLSHITRPLS